MSLQLDDDAPIALIVSGYSDIFGEVMTEVDTALRAAGYRRRLLGEEIEPGKSLRQAILDDVREAAVVLILVPERQPESFWVEVGIALGQEKPFVLVSDSEIERLPTALMPAITVGPVVTARGLSLAIQRAQRNRGTFKRLRVPSLISTGKPLGDETDQWVEQLLDEKALQEDRRTIGVMRYKNYEDWFARLLTAAEVPFERAVKTTRTGTSVGYIDFVVTAAELTDNLGALLPVELITTNRMKFLEPLRSRVTSFRQHLKATGANAILVVVRELDEPPQLLDSWDSAILLCSAPELVLEMREKTFGNAVIALRNRAVHLGDSW